MASSLAGVRRPPRSVRASADQHLLQVAPAFRRVDFQARVEAEAGIAGRQGPSCRASRGKIAGPGPRNSERRAPAGERLSKGARRGGWLGRREGANRSVAGCHVRIRARPRTTPEVVSKMGYRPFPTVSHGAWTPGKAPRRRTGVPACAFLRPLPDAPYRAAPLQTSLALTRIWLPARPGNSEAAQA